MDPLILIPIFICDLLCIHPFNDGNGRMSRLVTLLLLYQSGFMVGKYISIEQKIERTKETYYDVLGKISNGWHEGGNDYTSFIKYLLGIVLSCYRDLEERLGSMDRKSTPYEIVRKAVDNTLGMFTKAQILQLCPSIGSSSVEAALKRLKDEGYILRQGSGRNTAYVRNPDYV
ncbi:MAG: Fic family protein [Sphaerochaetaceae bacterium]|nr:Fic family protein [Sphaerochaetaceae bacterium]